MKIHQHNQAKYFLLPFLMLLMVSCEKEANISLSNVEDKVVVFSTFTPDQLFTLQLSKSKSLFSDSSFESLESAEIQICKGENCELLGPPDIIGGSDNIKLNFTTRNFQPQIDVPYSLKLKVEGISGEISANASVPKVIPLAHVAVGTSTEIPSDESSDDTKRYETKVSLSFDDPVGTDNYYQVNFYQIVDLTNGNLDGDTATLASVAYSSIDTDLVNLRNVTDDGILIDGKNFDGLTKDLLFRPIFEFNPNTETPSRIKIELRSVSKEYFDYYSSVYRQINQGSDPFIQPAQIVSNINNGLGIFAGYSKDAVIRDLEL